MTKKIFLSCLFLNLSILSVWSQKVQEPKEPYPYISEDVTYTNKTDNIVLSGTLTFPKNPKKVPVVILISGSGPQDRNSELMGHKPFLVLADNLTKKGIAVLRIDDRGTGKSQGVYNESSLNDFKKDTEFAIEYLKTRKEIDPKKIGLIGHSLGGVIASIIAANSNEASFIILLAGTGLRGDKLMLLQKEIIERKMGIGEEGIAVGQKNIGGAYDIILKSTSDKNKLEADLEKYFSEVFGAALPANQLKILSKQLTLPWLADFIKFDPATSLVNVRCPLLALNGSNDTQVPAKENLTAIKEYVQKSGNKHVTVMEIPNLNHLFQESETGLPQEYASIQETFSLTAMNIISDWIIQITM